MLDLSRVRNYYVAYGYTDLRRGIEGLAAIVTQQFGQELSEESLFLFCGRRTDRIKALYFSDDERICDKCGGKYEMIGKKLVSRRLEVIPRQCYVVEYYSCSYACKSCETKTGYANIVTTVTPPMLMKHSLASASTVANVMTQKYVGGLPLARQEKIWEREGICLSRATMSNWVIQCAQTWLKP